MKKRSVVHSALYGKACMNCFRAKSRCIPRPDSGNCERCHRLKRQCQPSNSIRKRVAERGAPDDARIARLEGRIDTIVSLLQTRQTLDGETIANIPASPLEWRQDHQQIGGSPASEERKQTTSTPTSSLGNYDEENAEVDIYQDAHDGMIRLPDTASGFQQPLAATATPSVFLLEHPHPMPVPDPQASEPLDQLPWTCLDTFRSRMLPYFPFIYLPPDLTASQLCRDRPLLFKAILCVACPYPSERRIQGIELKRVLCEAAFLREESQHQNGESPATVDLFLALMTYITWGWDYLHSRRSLSRLTALCVSLVGEMHLDKPIPAALHTASIFTKDLQRSQGARHLSLECQRAVLGCFVLGSVVSSYFADVVALRWTSQMDQIRVSLSASKEHPTDIELASQALLQLLSTRSIQRRNTLLTRDQKPASSHEGISQDAVEVTRDSERLLEQLQELRESLSWASNQHKHHASFVEVLVLETIRTSTAIASRPNASTSPRHSDPTGLSRTSNDHADQQSPPGTSNLQYMFQSIIALEACTSGLLSIPPSDFIGISFLQWAQLAGCIAVLAQLESLHDQRINLPKARGIVDLPVLLDHIAEKLELTAAEAREKHPDGVFTQLAAQIRAFRSTIQGSIMEVERPGPADVSGCGGSNVAGPRTGYLRNSRFWMDQLFVA